MLHHVLQAAEAAQAPIAINESTLYGSYNTSTGKVDLTERRPQFLEVRQLVSAYILYLYIFCVECFVRGHRSCAACTAHIHGTVPRRLHLATC